MFFVILSSNRIIWILLVLTWFDDSISLVLKLLVFELTKIYCWNLKTLPNRRWLTSSKSEYFPVFLRNQEGVTKSVNFHRYNEIIIFFHIKLNISIWTGGSLKDYATTRFVNSAEKYIIKVMTPETTIHQIQKAIIRTILSLLDSFKYWFEKFLTFPILTHLRIGKHFIS